MGLRLEGSRGISLSFFDCNSNENAALATEVWRQPAGTRQAFRDGIQRYIELVGAMLSSGDEKHGRAEAVTVLAAMVGAMALSRAIGDIDPSFSSEILNDVGAQLALFIEAKRA